MKRFFKFLLYGLSGILGLVILLLLALHSPWGKNYVRDKAVAFLEKKLKTEVKIATLNYSLPRSVEIQGLLLRDPANDTLVAFDRLSVRISPLALLGKKVTVRQLEVENLVARIYRSVPDSTYNFNYILEAFSSPEDTLTAAASPEAGTTASAWTFDVHKVRLQQIRFKYDDSSGGTFFNLSLLDLIARPGNLDLENLRFDISELKVTGVKSLFVTDTSYLPPPPEDTTTTDFQLAVDKLELQSILFTMLDKTDSFYFSANLGALKTQVKHFGLLDEEVLIDVLELNNTAARIALAKPEANRPELTAAEPVTASEAESDTSGGGWKVTARALRLNNIDFSMDNPAYKPEPGGIDFNHLGIQRFFLNAESIVYTADSISAQLKHLTLQEKSGFKVTELRAGLRYHEQGAALEDLYFLTPHSVLQHRVALEYPELSALTERPGAAKVTLELADSKIGMNDLLYFLTGEQRETFLPYRNQTLSLAAEMDGFLNDIRIKKLKLAGLKGTLLDIDGRLRGLPESRLLAYDLNIRQANTTYSDLSPFLPDSLKKQFALPEWLRINGTLRGSMEDYFPDLRITTADGNAQVGGSLLLSPGTGREKFDLNLSTEALNLGKILRMDSLGEITLDAVAAGTGFDPEQMNAQVSARVHAADYNGYRYSNLNLSGAIAGQLAELVAASGDPNLDFDLDARVDLSGEHPSLYAALQIGNLDLYALRFMSDSFRLAGDLALDFEALNPDYPSGQLVWRSPFLHRTGQTIALDSVHLESRPNADSGQQIALNISNILYTRMSGHIPLTQIGTALLAHLNRHYHLGDSLLAAEPVDTTFLHQNADEQGQFALENYDLSLSGHIKHHPVLHTFMPGLLPFDTIRFSGGLNPDTFGFDAYVPRLAFADQAIDSGRIQISENRDSFKYSLALKQYLSGNIELHQPSVRGRIRNDSIYTLANIKDAEGENQFTLGGTIYQQDAESGPETVIRVFKGLRFNYNIWNVDPENRIVLNPAGFYIRDFNLRFDNQYIRAHSLSDTASAPLELRIDNFLLSNVTSMLSKDSLLAEGHLNAEVDLQLGSGIPTMDAILTINQLEAYQQRLGNLILRVSNPDTNSIQTRLSLSGEGNDLKLNGNYYMEPVNGNNLDFNLTAYPLTAKTLQGLSFGAMKNSSGGLTGDLQIRGTTTQPVLEGTLTTAALKTTISFLNAGFALPQESITFSPGRIRFDDFTIEDQVGNAAQLNGQIRTRDYSDFFLDLAFSSNEWHLLNSTARDNPEYYGKLIFSSNIRVQGPATGPEVDGNIVIHDSTDLHYALLDKGPGIEESEGIVKFVDSRIPEIIDSALALGNKRRFSRSASVNVNVEVEEEATFTVLVDPASGDELQVKGEAALNTFLAPDGSIGLTGVYELDEGYYELNYNFLRRKFDIQPGSRIILSGEPLDAEADIVAVYKANIAPYDLVEKQASPEQLVYYKQRLPFEVQLKLKGKVMKPEIAFDIVLPEDGQNRVSTEVSNLVTAKLAELRNNPSEINKQVFAVLILGRFISDNPFSSGTGNQLEYAARQSVSKFLSDQLNNIAGQLINDFELNLGLNTTEDYTTGSKTNRTDLSVSASKELLNNRLKVTVGNDFQLEGPAVHRQQSSLIPGNLALDYQLSKDGRYMVRMYRSNELLNIIDGYVIETGVSFRIALEYNRFKYIFINRKKYMEKRRAERRKAAGEKAETDQKETAFRKAVLPPEIAKKRP